MRMPALLFILITYVYSGITHADGDSAAGKVKGYTCKGCHGIAGYKNAYPMHKVPKIGGQNSAYLVAALLAYQTGERPHPTMMLQAESLSQADINDIAAWLTGVDSGSSGNSAVKVLPELEITQT